MAKAATKQISQQQNVKRNQAPEPAKGVTALLEQRQALAFEDQEAYDALLQDVRSSTGAAGAIELLLAKEVVDIFWQLQRLKRYWTEMLDIKVTKQALAWLEDLIKEGRRSFDYPYFFCIAEKGGETRTGIFKISEETEGLFEQRKDMEVPDLFAKRDAGMLLGAMDEGDARARAEVESLLACYGLTLSSIAAMRASDRLRDLELIELKIADKKRELTAALKDFERHSESRARLLRQKLAVSEADFSIVDSDQAAE